MKQHRTPDRRPVPAEERMAVYWSFERSAFRLEQLDFYDVSADDIVYPAYLNGELSPPLTPGWEDWYGKVQTATQSGKNLRRVHIIPSVLTPYLRFEIEWAYALFNAPSGEEVFILSRDDERELASEASSDFYLFDDEKLVIINYDSRHRFQGLEIEQNPALIEDACILRDRLIEKAEPLKHFLAKIRSQPVSVGNKSVPSP